MLILKYYTYENYFHDFWGKILLHKWRELAMIGSGFEFYFH